MNRVLSTANGGKAGRSLPQQAGSDGPQINQALRLLGALLAAALLLSLSLRLSPGEPRPLQVRPEAPAAVPADGKPAAVAQVQAETRTHRMPPWRAAAQQ